MATLFIDSATPGLGLGVLVGDRIVTAETTPGTGHAERVGPAVRALLAGADVPIGTIDRLMVTVGPGSFMGIRVALSFAAGIAAGIGAVTVPVTTTAALACAFPPGTDGVVLMDARRGQVYFQAFADGEPQGPPELLTRDEAARAGEGHALRTGSAVPLLFPGEASFGPPCPDPGSVLRRRGRFAPGPLSAIYVRAPDATPSRRLLS